MARGRKKEALTPEERLQAALVPESEQPYQVRGNWCWVRLGASVNLYNGDRGTNYPSKKDYQSSGIPFINAGSIIDGELSEASFNYISEEKYDALRAGKIQQGDILYCLRGSLGKTAIVQQKFKGAISSSLCILRTNESLLKEFLYYLLGSNIILHQQVLAENGSAQPNLSAASVMEYMIPLPPIAEQQRIVDRIESLFAKLDEAKQKAQDALDSFETRKAAILHEAFTGELTAQWRKKNGLETAVWIEEKLKNCITLLSGQDFSPDKYNSDEKGIPYITGASNFENSHVCINRWTEKPSVIAQKGDILLVCKGSGYGKIIVADFEYAHIARQIMSLRVTGQLTNQFLLYYLENNIRYIRESGQGLIPGISRKIVLDMEISLPYIDEQFQIVRILDDILAKEQQAKKAAEKVLEQIDLIKKAILARAFRGELGTNDPNEESAVSLLKEIIATNSEKTNSTPKRQQKKPQVSVEIQMQLTTEIQEKLYRFILENPHCTVEQATSIDKNVLNAAQALRELRSKSLILQNTEDNTLTAVV